METDFGKDRLWAILSLKLDSVANQMVDTIWRYLVSWNRGQLERSNCGICQDKVNTPRGPVIILKMQHWYTVGRCLGMRCRIPTLQMREVRCQWKWQMQWYVRVFVCPHINEMDSELLVRHLSLASWCSELACVLEDAKSKAMLQPPLATAGCPSNAWFWW